MTRYVFRQDLNKEIDAELRQFEGGYFRQLELDKKSKKRSRRLCPGKQASELDSMTREIQTQKKKILAGLSPFWMTGF